MYACINSHIINNRFSPFQHTALRPMHSIQQTPIPGLKFQLIYILNR